MSRKKKHAAAVVEVADAPRFTHTIGADGQDTVTPVVDEVDVVEAEPVATPEPEPELELETPAVPTCTTCGVELTWRDTAYNGDSGLCKRCHAKAAKSAIKGRFAPMLVSATQDGKPTQRIVTSNRAKRRGQDALQPAPASRPRYLPAVRFAAQRQEAAAQAS